jgi:glycogen phosphorylase
MLPGTTFHIEVNPRIPRRLIRLEELANNLWYSWDQTTRTLFARLHPGLWDAVGHNPRSFLKRLDEHRLVEAADDLVFLGQYNRVLSAYDTYHNEPMRHDQEERLKQHDMVAYFCFEFGFHESFPIYSGGLGILAGDHCKAASDLRLPFVAVGLLYRQGYFTQRIDGDGNQVANYSGVDFDDLPVTPAVRDDGSEVRVQIPMPGRTVWAKVWVTRVGHVWLNLLDTDLPENADTDRKLTHQLYGGDRSMRIQQEIVLGIGGVRALAELGIKPTVWHMNEGHAAFLVLERVRILVKQGLNFHAALEAVAANTLFTTHTPVPAGHDHFSADMMREYFGQFCQEAGCISMEQLLEMGRTPDSHDFNMTKLALHGSRHHNGVSRIHGGVSARICADMWPEVVPEDNPMSYVTNGVHVPTFLAREWAEIFDDKLGYAWRHKLRDTDFWEGLDAAIPDHQFWNVHQSLKVQMLHSIRHRVRIQHLRNHGSEAHLDRMLRLANPLDPNVLTVGFARRFATYKRAALLFTNMDWLRAIISDTGRPVLLVFAGKAHPADKPGQELIRRIQEMSRLPELDGKLLLVEGYDLGMSRRLVSGVDVWLNTPIYPLEASGTSGMKAGINGAINLSVLDGWWDEGYDGTNGWAIKPSPEYYDDHRRDREDSRTLYELLQDHVIPLYYDRDDHGNPLRWVKMAKRSIATLLPRFNSTRMVGEYLRNGYLAASRYGARYGEANYALAREVAAWKVKVRNAWPGVRLRLVQEAKKRISFGEDIEVRVMAKLNGLTPKDVAMELMLGRYSSSEQVRDRSREYFQPDGQEGDEHIFTLKLTPDLCGRLTYRIRMYPSHTALTHPFETGLMVWL